MSDNLDLLVKAIEALDRESEAVCAIMEEVSGNRDPDTFDEQLHNAVMDLIYDASKAVEGLAPRARRARLNLIWKDFLAKHQARDIKA